MLERVTLTGADNTVNPSDLREIHEQYPFVEWGILIGSNGACHRFPSVDWIHQLIEERVATNNTMRLALHVCGGRLRAIANGRPDIEDILGARLGAFSRVQLNWHGERQFREVSEKVLESFCKMDGGNWDPEIIFQLDGVNDELSAAPSRRYRCSGLFDKSHGAGVLPGQWSKSRHDMPCGWAGGLGPENVVEEFHKIRPMAYGPFWIDMETKLYADDGRFDLSKCRSVLESMKPFVGV